MNRINTIPKDIDLIVKQYALRAQFTAKQLDQAEQLANAGTRAEKEPRYDARNLHFVTIDGDDAKDFDDAICLLKLPNNTFQLHVAIADVSFFVTPQSALDIEAQKRGTSIYFPDFVIPMLPPALSEGVCSLLPHTDRYVVLCTMDLTNDGDVSKYEFKRAIINSKHRLTYQKVDELLIANNQSDPLTVFLLKLNELRIVLEHKKMLRKALHVERKETVITLDAERNVKQIGKKEPLISQSIVEECMVLTNTCMANYLLKQYPDGAIYRTHQPPHLDDIIKLQSTMKKYGIAIALPPPSQEKKFYYAMLLEQIKKHVLAPQLYPLVLQSLPHACYTIDAFGHFGLALQQYTHCTSPIRRYSDIIAHRLLLQSLSSTTKQVPYSKSFLTEVSTICSDRERTSEQASRTHQALLGCLYVKQKISTQTQATIVSFYKHGAFVYLTQYGVEAFCKFKTDSIRSRRFRSRTRTSLHLEDYFSIGQTIEVTISDIDFDRYKITTTVSSKLIPQSKHERRKNY
ncbi:MAG: ribonuclease R [Methylacidiphilales bacterium]|nr:ribonuclease R [Candidatus Methylacidiphilales bacterium]